MFRVTQKRKTSQKETNQAKNNINNRSNRTIRLMKYLREFKHHFMKWAFLFKALPHSRGTPKQSHALL